jgi:uncharacterized protein (TIGR00251 family)
MKDAGKVDVRDGERGALLSVKVVPGSSRNRVIGVLGDMLKVATSSPPEKGKANRAVVGILAGFFDVDKSRVEITGGMTSERKEFCIMSKSAEEIYRRLEM